VRPLPVVPIHPAGDHPKGVIPIPEVLLPDALRLQCPEESLLTPFGGVNPTVTTWSAPVPENPGDAAFALSTPPSQRPSSTIPTQSPGIA